MPALIVGVAIVFENQLYSLPAPNRHHNVIRLIAEENGVGINGPDVQGFVDQSGKFYNRRQAMTLVRTNGQLKIETTNFELFSEDLW
jgi:hypothetical protein